MIGNFVLFNFILLHKRFFFLLSVSFHSISYFASGPAVAKSDEPSASERRARVRGLPGETLPCTLMAPGACKIRRFDSGLNGDLHSSIFVLSPFNVCTMNFGTPCTNSL